jgi:two-component system OmpR family sensor kinase
VSDDSEHLREELQRAKDALKQQESFLAVIAHELRNPIAPVLISLDALMLDVTAGNVDRDMLLRRMQATRRYVDGMRTHLDRLLDFSRLRSGHIDLRPEEMDLSVQVGAVLDEMAPLIQAAQCELITSFTMPLTGSWDPMRVRQIVWNLVSNAVKYAAAAPIEVTTAKDEKTVRVSVTDHGPGISDEDRELVFRRFERTGSSHHTGFGVGLWLVRRLTEAMGGSIELQSKVGVGSTFTVRLPRSVG